MKRLYWRPQRISTRVVLALALVAVAGMLSVEVFRVEEKTRWYKEKIRAAKLCAQAYQIIREERRRRRIRIDPRLDPARSGLVGQLISPGTTNTGHLPAKLTSVNPNWAAVAVHLLGRAGVQEGDVVALGVSGSFPALNIAALTAIKAMKARAVTISSAGASQWGANIPGFMWPDMERTLVRRGLLPEASVAVSLGGLDDRGTGLSEEGLAQLKAAIQHSGRPALEVTGFVDSLRRRMVIYRQHAGEGTIRAYVNIGGGTVSVGTAVGKATFKAGLNRWLPRGAGSIDSVMTRFSKSGVPVIHFSKIAKLAERYGLPAEPRSTPAAGQGKIFIREGYSPWLAGGVLAVLVLLMVALLRLDLAYRLRSTSPAPPDAGGPEPMI